jgi:hypothetical protein
MFRQVILKSLQKATGLDKVEIDVPAQDSFGDYSSNAAMQQVNRDKKLMTEGGQKSQKSSVTGSSNPRTVAEDIKKKLEADIDLMQVMDKIDIAGPGFINFILKKEMLIGEMNQVLEKGAHYGRQEIGKGQTSLESATASGMAHLLSFYGTDTIPAIDALEKYYFANSDKEIVGGSVAATEHSVMCFGGKETEEETYRRLIQDVYPKGIVSIVSDTWDYWKILTETLPSLKDLIMSLFIIEKSGRNTNFDRIA